MNNVLLLLRHKDTTIDLLNMFSGSIIIPIRYGSAGIRQACNALHSNCVFTTMPQSMPTPIIPYQWCGSRVYHLSPAYILTISTRFTVAPLVFTQRLRSRLLIRRIVFRRRCVNTHGATVNRGEIVSMYAGL